MRPDTGWATVQMPIFISANQHQKPTYVHPDLKAAEAATLRADIEVFLVNGGQIEQITTPRPIKRNGWKA